MAIFINQTHPQLTIYNPATNEFAQFVGGKLDIDEDDPNYEVVLAEAQRNPTITMLAGGVQCVACGEVFAGKAGKAQLGKHTKEVHFDLWLAGKQAENEAAIQSEVLKRSPFACDACQRVQEFATADELAAHVAIVHTAVDVDDDGNVGGEGPGETAGATAAVPAAAKPAKAKS